MQNIHQNTKEEPSWTDTLDPRLTKTCSNQGLKC